MTDPLELLALANSERHRAYALESQGRHIEALGFHRRADECIERIDLSVADEPFEEAK